MKKKNLSIVTITLSNGGAERVISVLLKKLVEDFNVTLVLFYDVVDYEIPLEVNKIVLLNKKEPSTSIINKVKDLISLKSKYSKVLKENDVHVSMSFLMLPNIINGLISKKNKNVKTIISERCFPSLMYKYNKVSMLLAKIAFPLFYNRNDMLFSNSIHINEDLENNFGVKIPMSVIYNAIEIPKRFKNPNKIVVSEQLNIINVGTLYGPKNQRLILDAMGIKSNHSVHLTILGKGPFEKDLKLQAKELNIASNVSFKGRVNNVHDYLFENDCFILSSNNEGFPNVLLEAMAVGLPVISTNCMSGPLELLNENEPISIEKGNFVQAKYGLMINVGDAEGLSKAMMHYKKDIEQQKKYSELSLKRAKDYELATIYKQVKNLIIE